MPTRYGYVSKANANGGSRYPEHSNHARSLPPIQQQFSQRTFRFCRKESRRFVNVNDRTYQSSRNHVTES